MTDIQSSLYIYIYIYISYIYLYNHDISKPILSVVSEYRLKKSTSYDIKTLIYALVNLPRFEQKFLILLEVFVML